ncbi:oxidoreductase family protein [Abortiporus biennis]|nr:oxidoreductase family protein [Abortiporus biennis]
MSPPGIAILGAGIFAKEAHLPAIASLGRSNVELKAVYSRSEKSAEQLAVDAQGILKLDAPPTVYHDENKDSNLDILLARKDISAVIIALPIVTQPSIIRKSLASGKHVLSEKPVAPDVAAGIDLIREYYENFKGKGLIWRVAENWEVEPGYHAAADIIKAGKIGKVTSFNARVVNHVPKDSKWYKTPWRTIPDYQGGFLLDGGVHTIAALRVILPSPMVSLSGYASLNLSYLAPQDTINAVVKSKDGSHGIVELTWGAPVLSRASEAQKGISITGTEGWIWIEQTTIGDGQQIFRVTVKVSEKNEKGEEIGETKVVLNEPVKGVEEELRRFLNAIAGEDDGFGDPYSALKDVAFIQAALNSNGAPIDLEKLVEY